ncbi:MAG: S24 family peptidase, partial [Nitrospiria bacterium]
NYLMRVRDGAMEPIFKKDDLVSMQTWSQDLVPLTGQIVAAWLPKEGIITRWLSNEQGMWILRPQSRGYSIFPIEKKEETTFFKVLCWCGKQTQHGIPPA